jgi:hypothetical protein
MPFWRPLVLAGLLVALILGYAFRSHLSQPELPFGQPIQASKPLPLSGRTSVGKPAEERTCDGIPLPCIPDPPKSPQPGAVWTPSDDGPNGIARVTQNASMLLSNKRFADLDALIERYNTLQYRLDDGRFKLSVIGLFFEQSLGANGDSIDSELQSWVKENPKSAGAAIATATAWSNAAWRARGNGTANTVSREGWKLFHERLQRALAALRESESYASSNPLWYTEYMQVNLGLDVPLSEQLAIYERGTEAFPEFFPLHMQMMVALLPQWQGSYKAEAAFIDLASAHSPPTVRAETYTRLWWRANQLTDLDVDIFRDMGASWPRMKEGFESLMKTYPNSRWNRSNFAAFACDAGDVSTYVRLRAELGEKIYSNAFPPNGSIDVCDARAAGKRT